MAGVAHGAAELGGSELRLPVTSIGYVLVALAGSVFLHEQITVRRWAGIALIMAGVALVSGGTAPQTTARPRAKAAVGAR